MNIERRQPLDTLREKPTGYVTLKNDERDM